MIKRQLSIADKENVELAMRVFIALSKLEPRLLNVPSKIIAHQLSRVVGIEAEDFVQLFRARMN